MKRRTYWAEQVFVMFVRILALVMIFGSIWIAPYFAALRPAPHWMHEPILMTGGLGAACGVLLYLWTL